MSKVLAGKRVAMLVEDGFEQVELTGPRQALENEGAEVAIVSPQKEAVRGWNPSDWGDRFPVDVPLDEARASDFDALVLPGGSIQPPFDRTNRKRRSFTTRLAQHRL
jgi:protease I